MTSSSGSHSLCELTGETRGSAALSGMADGSDITRNPLPAYEPRCAPPSECRTSALPTCSTAFVHGRQESYVPRYRRWHGRAASVSASRKTKAEVVVAVQKLEKERDAGSVRKPGR